MMTINVDARQIKRLRAAVRKAGKSIPREVAAAFNDTARKAKGDISREIRKELASPAAAVNKLISITRRANANSLTAAVQLKKTKRIPLRDFGARQTRAGVSYKISKNKGRRVARGAFQGPKPGVMKASWKGNVFKRVGAARLPIVKLMGPSPWGVFVENNLTPLQVKAIEAELRKQIERRIKLNTLRANGLVKS